MNNSPRRSISDYNLVEFLILIWVLTIVARCLLLGLSQPHRALTCLSYANNPQQIQLSLGGVWNCCGLNLSRHARSDESDALEPVNSLALRLCPHENFGQLFADGFAVTVSPGRGRGFMHEYAKSPRAPVFKANGGR